MRFRFVKGTCDQLKEDADFGKKIIFSSKIEAFATQKTRTHTLKSRGTQNKGIIEPFFFENEQGLAVTANDNRYRAMLNEFLFTKLKWRILATFGFNRTALCAT